MPACRAVLGDLSCQLFFRRPPYTYFQCRFALARTTRSPSLCAFKHDFRASLEVPRFSHLPATPTPSSPCGISVTSDMTLIRHFEAAAFPLVLHLRRSLFADLSAFASDALSAILSGGAAGDSGALQREEQARRKWDTDVSCVATIICIWRALPSCLVV